MKWYQKSWATIVFLVVFFPLGLFTMWKYTNWSKIIKIIITVLIGIGLLSNLFNNNEKNDSIKTTPPQTTNTPKIEPTQLPTSKPIEKFNIVISSQIIKKVNNKYRYFFDIRNKDTKDFEGSVEITLYGNVLSSPVGKETYKTTRAIEPNLGFYEYLDINTGPKNESGEYGITKFKYKVLINNTVVNNGEGQITNKYEDLSKF